MRRLSIFPIFLLLTKILAIEWSRDQFVDNNKTTYIQWNFDETNLTMKVTTKTTGWLGVGFSANPSMKAADIVMCWVKDGKGYIQDRHGLEDKNGRPPIDEQSNYKLLEANENDTYTSCTFQRRLITCDKEDFEIKNGTVQVLWAFNDKDPENLTVNGAEMHGSKNRGAVSTNIIGAQFQMPNTTDLKTFNITMNNITVPGNQDTLYWCRFFEMPYPDKKLQLVGYTPVYTKDHEELLHHAVIYECTGENIEDMFNKLINDVGYDCSSVSSAFLHCQKALIVWVVGSKGEFYPEYVGFPFGSYGNSKVYYVLDNHYNNPTPDPIYDSSGFTLYYTEKPRKYEARMFTVGEKLYLPYLILPPAQKEYVVVAHCSPDCMKKGIPKDGIKAFGGILHSHLTGIKMVVRHFRDGVELPPLFENEHYDFDYQQAILLQKEVTILPDDRLTLECTFNTMKRNETTVVSTTYINIWVYGCFCFCYTKGQNLLNSHSTQNGKINGTDRETFMTANIGGLATSDEMCEVYIMYYPAMDLIRCFSIMNSSDIFGIVGIDSVYPTKTDLDKVIIKSPPSLANQSFVDFMHSYKWNQSQVDALQMLEYTSPKVPQCRDSSGFIEGLKSVNYSDAIPYTPPDVCKSS